MTGKRSILLLVILIITIVVGAFSFPDREEQEIVETGTDITLQGDLIKKPWTKSPQSYCAQGSDYFSIQTGTEELVLDYAPLYTEAQVSAFVGETVLITGTRKEKEIECEEGSQCPSTPNNLFSCEVFSVKKINTLK